MVPLVKTPPAAPLPDPDENRGWYGEFQVQYPLDESLHTLNSAHFFEVKCGLSLLLNDLCASLFAATSQASPPSTEELKQHLKTLGAWHFFLPPSQSPAKVVYPFELNLQYVQLPQSVYAMAFC